MKYNLFLDDIRNPEDAFLYYEEGSKRLIELSGITNWLVVRNFESFVKTINDLGLPCVVSFDHDLHFEHVKYYVEETILTGKINYDSFINKTGKHCADFLVEKVNVLRVQMPQCYVHSANEYGAKEIRKVLKND
jgi:hypothetical protein